MKKLGLEAEGESCSCLGCLATLQGEVLIEDKSQKEETEAELDMDDMRKDLQ